MTTVIGRATYHAAVASNQIDQLYRYLERPMFRAQIGTAANFFAEWLNGFDPADMKEYDSSDAKRQQLNALLANTNFEEMAKRFKVEHSFDLDSECRKQLLAFFNKSKMPPITSLVRACVSECRHILHAPCVATFVTVKKCEFTDGGWYWFTPIITVDEFKFPYARFGAPYIGNVSHNSAESAMEEAYAYIASLYN